MLFEMCGWLLVILVKNAVSVHTMHLWQKQIVDQYKNEENIFKKIFQNYVVANELSIS